ncbi:hypothetical protein [Mycobacterium sp. M26]|uniref:hypothetical protein n=1 Tax=Mycobacterium sp. M26 TaxID=1762962 RepID=UPI00073E86FB|nr:hypothetical protein [Mycobacterium sp. M26]
MTPVVAQHDLALPAIQAPAASASVQLAGFDSPITELLGSIFLANEYLTDPSTMVPLPAPWTGTVSAFGLLPQIITDALPIIRQLGLNGSDNLYYGVGGLLDSASTVSEGAWNAIGDLASLDVQGAITTLVTAVQTAGAQALAAGNYVLQGVIARATAVVNNVVPILGALPQIIINQGLVAVGSVVKIVTDAVDALSQANPVEGVWNAVVDGLLGQGGVPGALLSLTIGVGVPAPAPISAFVPSIRTVASSLVQAVASGLATPNPAPTPFAAVAAAKSAAPEAPTAASLRSAAAEEESTPAADNSKSDEGSTGGSSATAGDNNNSGSASSDEGGSKGGGKSTGGSKRAHKAKSAD